MEIMNSPKNKFRYQLTYGKPLKGIGSVSSFTSNHLDENHNVIKHHANQAKKNNTTLNVVVLENKKVYLGFDWQKVKSFEI